MDRMIEGRHRKGVGVKLKQERKDERLLLETRSIRYPTRLHGPTCHIDHHSKLCILDLLQ